jgi:hypothetical protein
MVEHASAFVYPETGNNRGPVFYVLIKVFVMLNNKRLQIGRYMYRNSEFLPHMKHAASPL